MYRFGLYEADPSAGTLTKQGISIRLQEQPFRILILLLESAGEMVSRDELRGQLWPEGTFVEFDGSLNTALMKLRAALNDDAENPRFIVTVPRKGYRFIAPVQSVGMVETEPVEAAAPHTQEQNGAGNFPKITSAPAVAAQNTSQRRVVILGLVCAALAAILLWRLMPIEEPRVARVTQLTHTGRIAPESRIVTDGSRVFFVAQENGRWSLMQTSVQGGSVEKVAAPFEDTMIFDVSPDRTHLLIGPYPREGEDVPVWVWPAHGGTPHRLGDVYGREAAWSPDGKAIAFLRENKIFTVHTDGSALHELGNSATPMHALVWSPNGASLRFTQTHPERGTDEIWEVNLNGSNLHKLDVTTGVDTHASAGTWLGDGKYFLFTAGSDSHLNLAVDTLSNVWAIHEGSWLWHRGSGAQIEMTHGPISYFRLAASSDPDRIFALGKHPEYQLVRFDPKTGVSSTVLADAGATEVDFSPDGNWIVYSLRGNGALWKSRRDGTQRIELTPRSPGAFAPQWSADGKEILFTGFFLENKPQLYLVPADGGQPKRVLPKESTGTTLSGDWSPDGKRIVLEYQEQNADSKPDIRVLDPKTGQVTILPSSEGLTRPRWSPTGSQIAAVNQYTHRIVLYDEAQKQWSFLTDAQKPLGMRWSADGMYLYFQDGGDPELGIFRVNWKTLKAERVMGFGPQLGGLATTCHFIGVGPDGSIYATMDRGGTDVYALDVTLP